MPLLDSSKLSPKLGRVVNERSPEAAPGFLQLRMRGDARLSVFLVRRDFRALVLG